MAAPTVSPSTATVFVGGTVKFTSPDSVNWSIAPGSAGSIDPDGTYHAPASFYSKNVIAGCPVVPNDHIYNVDVTSFPVHSSSTARMANIGTGIVINFEPSFPINYMTNTTPTDTMKFRYTTSSDGRSFPILPTPYRGVENSLYPSDYFAQDRHQLGVNTDTCQFTEIYNYYPIGTNIVDCPTCNAQSGVQYGPMSYQLANGDGSTDAAGLYILPLAIRYDELKAGVINHALRFTLSSGYNYSGFDWPGTNFAANCATHATCVPYGSRFRLKASFSEVGFSDTALAIIRALKKYGMFDSDNGTNFHIQTMADVLSDTTTFNALMVEIPASSLDSGDFEIVDESSVRISTATGRVRVPNALNVVPDNYAVVVATKIADNTTNFVYVALEPVTVGFKNPAFPVNDAGISVMSGTPQFQIPYYVHGATDTTVSCTMSPTIGSLTSDCLYTAPTSGVVASSTTFIKISPTNIAVSGSSVTFPLTVFSSDAIRMDVGRKAASISSPAIPYSAAGDYGPDSAGKFWAADPTGTLPPWHGVDDNSSPQSSWPTPTDVGLYYTQRHGIADAAWSAMVPNGNYTLTLKFGNSDSNQILHSSMSIDTQSVVVFSTTSAVIPGYTTFTPADKSYAVTVTDKTFYFALREVYNQFFPFISAWKLTLDNPIPTVPTNPETWFGKITVKGKVRMK